MDRLFFILKPLRELWLVTAHSVYRYAEAE